MKKRVCVVVLAMLLLFGSSVCAKEKNALCEPIPMEATAYYYGSITASGTKPRHGICAAKKEWMGLTAVVYEDNAGVPGALMGIYEIKDTGGDYRIKNGTCIDIYMNAEKACWEFGRQKVLVQIIDAKG